MNNSSALCQTATFLAHSTQLWAMLILRVICAVIGILFFIVLFKVQGTNLAFHRNAQILLISHHFWAILHSIANLIVHTSSIIRLALFLGDNPCQYLMTMEVSVLLRGQMVITMYGQVWALAAMAIERWVATSTYRTYERKNSTLGKFFVPIEWILSSIWLYLVLIGTDWSEMKAYATVTSTNTSTQFSNLMIVLAVVELLTLASFYGMLWYNRRRKLKLEDAQLTEKYQIDENIRATTLMIPMVWTHFCLFMPTFVLFPIYTAINPSLNPRYYAVFLETFNLVPFYSVALPVVLFWRHKALRRSLWNSLDINRVFPSVPREDGKTHEQAQHFELLEQMWLAAK